jgi:hypothetical protein
MFQVTAVFQDAEIGYGEGEGAAYAIAECIDSVDSFYLGLDPRAVEFRIIGGSVGRATMTMDVATLIAYQ